MDEARPEFPELYFKEHWSHKMLNEKQIVRIWQFCFLLWKVTMKALKFSVVKKNPVLLSFRPVFPDLNHYYTDFVK